MNTILAKKIETAVGSTVTSMAPLAGGCVGEVYRANLTDNTPVVVKVDSTHNPTLDIEGYMLRYLADHTQLPVPRVIHTDPALLIMQFIEGESRFGRQAEQHAAELLSALHKIAADQYGLERDTLIGGLHQPNTPTNTWIDFFREHRLIAMAHQAVDAGQMNKAMLRRVDSFAEKCDALLEEPAHPALLHGDIWSANVLASGNRITGFIDPAIYYGHPEIELAFITLFSTFSDTFFRHYHERAGIAPGFFEVRRDIYNLYPLLVHVRLFGGGYLTGIERVLSRHGC